MMVVEYLLGSFAELLEVVGKQILPIPKSKQPKKGYKNFVNNRNLHKN
jgi:hypothetical protein